MFGSSDVSSRDVESSYVCSRGVGSSDVSRRDVVSSYVCSRGVWSSDVSSRDVGSDMCTRILGQVMCP